MKVKVLRNKYQNYKEPLSSEWDWEDEHREECNIHTLQKDEIYKVEQSSIDSYKRLTLDGTKKKILVEERFFDEFINNTNKNIEPVFEEIKNE